MQLLSYVEIALSFKSSAISDSYNPSAPTSRMIPVPVEKVRDIDVQFKTENTEVSYSLNIDQFGVIYAICEFLQSSLRKAERCSGLWAYS